MMKVSKKDKLTPEQHLQGAARDLQSALQMLLGATTDREANAAVIFAKRALQKSMGGLNSTES